MYLLRRPLLCRLMALWLLVGLGAWVTAPLAAAHPRLAAAQAALSRAGGPAEQALADALAEAARHADAPEAFEAALLAALSAQPDGDALARYVAAAGSPEALLDLLLGQLLRNPTAPGPLLAAAAGPAPAVSAPNSARAVLSACGDGGAATRDVGAVISSHPASVAGLLVSLSPAQPRGP